MVRLSLNLILLCSVVFLPPLALLVGVVLLARYQGIELVAWGLLFDALYATPTASLFHFQYVGTSLAVFLVLIAAFLKSRLVWYHAAP